VNLPEAAAEKPEPLRVSKTAATLMLITIVSLATLAVFANLQRFRHNENESVVVRPVKPAASVAPEQ
jgi:predicted small integral membrane protein